MSIKLLHPRLSTIKKRGCWTSSTFFFFDIIHVLSTFNFPPSTSTFFKMTESHLLLSMTPTCKLTSMVINDTLTAFFFYSASVQGAHMERPLWIWISLNRFNLPEINFPQLMHFFNINEYQWQIIQYQWKLFLLMQSHLLLPYNRDHGDNSKWKDPTFPWESLFLPLEHQTSESENSWIFWRQISQVQWNCQFYFLWVNPRTCHIWKDIFTNECIFRLQTSQKDEIYLFPC